MAKIKWLSALALGLLAAGSHVVYVSRIENKAKGGMEVAIISVATDIGAGDKIARENLATRTIPLSYLDDRTVRADRVEEIIDLVAAVDLEEGQLVQWTDFTDRKGLQASDLADRIEPGQRAMTISVDRSLSMGGMLRPGHRVDISELSAAAPPGVTGAPLRCSRTSRCSPRVVPSSRYRATPKTKQSHPPLEA
jgi:Flp pilus assembly protein CpaB